LFYGGFGAGILLAGLLILTVSVLCLFYPSWGLAGTKATWKQRWVSLGGAYETILLFLLVILGLYKGIFTAAEAGAAGSLLAILIGVCHKNLSWKNFLFSIRDTLRSSCMVITIIAGAVIFGKFLTITRIPF